MMKCAGLWISLASSLVVGLVGCGKSTPGLPESQQEMYEEVRRIEGVASIDMENPEIGVYVVDLSNTKADDAFVARLVEFPELQRLVLDNTQVTDGVVQHIKKLTKLQQLSIGSTKVVVKTDYQDSEDGKKIRIDTPTQVPLLSPGAVNAIRAAMPDLLIEGVEQTAEEMETPA